MLVTSDTKLRAHGDSSHSQCQSVILNGHCITVLYRRLYTFPLVILEMWVVGCLDNTSYTECKNGQIWLEIVLLSSLKCSFYMDYSETYKTGTIIIESVNEKLVDDQLY